MAVSSISLLLCLSLCISVSVQSKPESHLTSPYLSPTTFSPNYQNMLDTFKIFIYKPDSNVVFNTLAESIFYTSLINSTFVTQNAQEAHLFFIPFSPNLSARSISRLVRKIRIEFPYWNRTLGADHFYLSCKGIGYNSDRNILELKKNSVQISCLGATESKFIPHKDITLPPVNPAPVENDHSPVNTTASSLAYYYSPTGQKELSFLGELYGDSEFVIELGPSDGLTRRERIGNSRFCLLVYGSDVSWIGETLRFGCVPVVISDRPIQDLPFMDVLRWQQIAVFLGNIGGARELKSLLRNTNGDRYVLQKNSGMAVSQHFEWNPSPQPYDSFHMIMYQLWLRRHTIRYAPRDQM